MIHLAPDCGRCEVKTVGPNGYRDKFRSVIGEARTLRLINELRPTDIILKSDEIGDWYIGDLAADESYGAGVMMFADKLHRDTHILTVAAVARAVKNGETVSITTGVPIQFHTKDTKERMARLLEGAYRVEINGQLKCFVIRDVRVATEGAAAYMVLCPGKGGTKRFIDIGSRTVNFGTVRNGRYIDKESGTLDYGLGYGPYRDNLADFCRRAITDMSGVWRSFSDETYLLGGGTKRCSEAFQAVFSHLQCAAQPEFVNALAFHKIGESAI